VNLLLDTHVLLWALMDDARLEGAGRDALLDGRNRVLVSAASAWEMAIKTSLGRLAAPDDLVAQLAAARFEPLEVTFQHALHVGSLPAHHGDPFDRMLVSQAIVEGLILVTADRTLARYEVDLLQV
jgi:PIN domain nuclease of toxin-antitoxin system